VLTGVSDGDPVVLVLHTHSSEGYLPQGCTYVEGCVGDATYTKNGEQNVISVGRVLVEVLNEKGITALHCTVMHDEPRLGGAYRRSAETVKRYLEQYPEIEYVIDLHRDSVTTADGKIVRSLGRSEDGEAVAQIMAVVGSDGNGTPCENWEGNLSLALRLRQLLNEGGGSICRPVTLRNSSYNQELSPYSLLLEIGTGGNSVKEAERAAKLVGEALVTLILGT
jgi:stage II sporulation protein P